MSNNEENAKKVGQKSTRNDLPSGKTGAISPLREYARNLNLVRWGLAFFCLVYAGTYIYQALEEDMPSFTLPELTFAAVLVGAGLMLSWKLGQKRAEVLSQLAHEKEQPPTHTNPSDSDANSLDRTNYTNAED